MVNIQRICSVSVDVRQMLCSISSLNNSGQDYFLSSSVHYINPGRCDGGLKPAACWLATMFPTVCSHLYPPPPAVTASLPLVVGRWLSWLRQGIGDPGDTGKNPVTAITYSCAAIHFTAVYNLPHHQLPDPLIRCIYGVERRRLKIPRVGKVCRLRLSPPHLIHHITAMI